MFIYGKMAANAIAVMSYLATAPSRRAGPGEIARARRISQALTAKLLTQLSLAGLLLGQPGPGGGYTLAKPAGEISLLDIVCIFENTEPPSVCPFGHGWCGKGEACPLHDAVARMIDSNRRFMEETRLSIFTSRALTRKPEVSRSRVAKR